MFTFVLQKPFSVRHVAAVTTFINDNLSAVNDHTFPARDGNDLNLQPGQVNKGR